MFPRLKISSRSCVAMGGQYPLNSEAALNSGSTHREADVGVEHTGTGVVFPLPVELLRMRFSLIGLGIFVPTEMLVVGQNLT